eukprot:CCRYP_008410-RA/>CCRYP_008410-RA protein AED:0.19 eAED:0.19 QI:0/-1/0/1/-1/1/1/0/292
MVGDERRAPEKPPSERYHYEYTSIDTNGNKFSKEELERIAKVERATTNISQVIRKYGNASLPSLDPNAFSESGWKIESDNPWSDAHAAVREIVAAGEEIKEAWGNREGNIDMEESIAKSDRKTEEWWNPILSYDSSKSNGSNRKSPSFQAQRVHSVNLSAEEQTQFEQVHMEWATNAFADELEALRNGQFGVKYGATAGKKKIGGTDVMLDLDPNEHSFIVAKRKKEIDEVPSMREEVDVQVLADMLRSGSNVFSGEEKKMLLRAKLRGEKIQEKCENVPNLHDIRKCEIGF